MSRHAVQLREALTDDGLPEDVVDRMMRRLEGFALRKRKAARVRLDHLPANARLRARTRSVIATQILRVLNAQKKAAATAARRWTAKFAKRVGDDDEIAELQRAVADHPYDEELRAKLRAALAHAARERAAAALEQLAPYMDTSAAEFAALLTQANEHSVRWAAERVGNLVTEVSDTTRKAINDLVSQAVKEGWSNDRLGTEIEDAFSFSKARGDLIARTETADTESQGTLDGFRLSGVVEEKAWWADPDACDECQANADAGPIPLDDTFPSGDDAPTAHPRCECALEAVLSDVAS